MAPRRADLYPTMMVGHLKLIGRVRSSGGAKWRVECTGTTIDGSYCGNRLTIPQWYLVRDKPKTHCGCQFATLKSAHPKIRRAWMNMRLRCNYPRHVAYAEYGGRGISVCPEWNDPDTGFESFLRYLQTTEVGLPPSDTYTLDRINNDGNYEPGNIRWATPTQQRANQRPRRYKS